MYITKHTQLQFLFKTKIIKIHNFKDSTQNSVQSAAFQSVHKNTQQIKTTSSRDPDLSRFHGFLIIKFFRQFVSRHVHMPPSTCLDEDPLVC